MKDKGKEVWWTTLRFDIRRTSISRHFTKSGIFFFYDVKKNNSCRNYVPSVSHTAQNILHNCRRSSFATIKKTEEKKKKKKLDRA